MDINAFNWCGVRVKNDGGQFAGSVFKSVSATWTVPKLAGNPKAGDTWYLASWVGLDGGTNLDGWSKDLLQAGVYQTRDNGGDKDCHAFCEWNVTKDSKYPPDPDLPPVQPGNDVSVAITVEFDGAGNATAAVTFTNLTNNDIRHKPPIKKPINAVFKGDTIEWVVERAAVVGGGAVNEKKHEKMADIANDAFEFKNAGGLTQANVQVAPDKGDLVHMEEDENPGTGNHICKVKVELKPPPINNLIHIDKKKHNP